MTRNIHTLITSSIKATALLPVLLLLSACSNTCEYNTCGVQTVEPVVLTSYEVRPVQMVPLYTTAPVVVVATPVVTNITGLDYY